MTDNTFPQTGLPLSTVDDGKVPKYRLANAANAQSIVETLWTNSLPRNAKNAAIQGQIDGNPPYRPSAQRAQGRAGEPNFNTLEAKATVSAAMVPVYDLFSGATHYVEFKTDFGDSKRKSKWSRIITTEWDRTLKRWSNFDYVMQQMLLEFIVWGKGFLAWDDRKSWRFNKVDHYRTLVPDGTLIDIDKLELVVVLKEWRVHELYAMIKNEKSAKEVGWNIKATMDAIAEALPNDPVGGLNPLACQQALKDDDLYVSSRSNTIQTGTLFVREFDGKWSECIVRRNHTSSDPTVDNKRGGSDYLFESRKNTKSILDSIVPFFFDVQGGTWNGANGLGRDIYTLMQLKDRLACTQANAVFLRNSLVLQPRQALDKEKMNLLQIGAVTWLPENAEVHQGTILGDIASTIEVGRELGMMIQRNTGVYMPTMEKGSGNPQTATEFQAKFAQSTVISVSAVNRLYAQLDRLYQVMWNRLLHPSSGDSEASKEARLFKERCVEQGVPEEAFEKVDSIKAWRNIGNGSVAVRQQTLQGFLGMYGMLKSNGQQALLEDIISVSGSPSQVGRFMPDEDWDDMPTDQQEVALLENAAMKIGAPITWTPTQNNLIHAQTHMQAGAQASNSVQQGGNIMEVIAFINAIGAHTLIHLQREAQNPSTKEVVGALEKQLQKLGQVNDSLKQIAQKQMEIQKKQTQKTQEAMSDADLKRFEAQEKIQLSKQKAAATIALKIERQKADIELKQQAHATDLTIKDATAANAIAIKNAEQIWQEKKS